MRFFTGATTGAEGEADNDCYSSVGNVVCDRWILRAHNDVATCIWRLEAVE